LPDGDGSVVGESLGVGSSLGDGVVVGSGVGVGVALGSVVGVGSGVVWAPATAGVIESASTARMMTAIPLPNRI
jgi:ribose 5-phosphate isomerase RpiB